MLVAALPDKVGEGTRTESDLMFRWGAETSQFLADAFVFGEPQAALDCAHLLHGQAASAELKVTVVTGEFPLSPRLLHGSSRSSLARPQALPTEPVRRQGSKKGLDAVGLALLAAPGWVLLQPGRLKCVFPIV